MNQSAQKQDNELNLPELEEQINNISDRIIIVLFTVPWSGNGSMMRMVLQELEDNNSDKVAFYSIDVDKYSDALAHFGMTDIPTITLYYKQEVVGLYNQLISQHILQRQVKSILAE